MRLAKPDRNHFLTLRVVRDPCRAGIYRANLSTIWEGETKSGGGMKFGAGDGTRTRNPQLGKLMRYHCATPAQRDVEKRKIVKTRVCVNAIR
jgi:hypothetical protein